MKRIPLCLQSVFALAVLTVAMNANAEPPTLDFQPLWPDGAPAAKGAAPEDIPSVSFHPAPESNNSGATVIVCPGGGYWIHAMDHEGLQVCQWLNEIGVNAFLLKYRLKSNDYEPNIAIGDGKRAVRWVRNHADRFDIDPNRLGMLGFSAGGHLASAIGIDHDSGDPNHSDPIERESCRPNFLVLAYSAMAGDWRSDELSFANQPVTEATPPSFIFHTDADPGVKSTWATRFYNDLHEAGVSAELHIFGGYGPHGIGLAPGDATAKEWPTLCQRWMRKMGYLSDKPRQTLSGRIQINDTPIHRGWITLTPIDSPFDPIVSLYIPHANEGQFEFDTTHGPAAGHYAVQVIHLANALDPEPSVAGATTYTKHPKTGAPLKVEIRADEQNALNLNL